MLTACGTNPTEKLDASAVAALSVSAAPQENVSNFSSVLECVGTQIARYGTTRLFVGADQIRNETGVREGVPESGRTMLQSAFSTLVEHSNGKVSWAGWSSAVDTRVNAGFAQESKAWSKDRYINDTPDFSIFGAITQFEKNVQKASRDATLAVAANRLGNYESADLSVLAANLTLHDNKHANFAIYKGIQASHVILMKATDVDAGITLGATNVGGVSFNVAMVRKEGVSAALMNLMQLGAIEIAGKYYKNDFDYRQCLNPNTRSSIISSTAWKKAIVSDSENQPVKKLNLKLKTVSDPEYEMPLLIKATTNIDASLYCFYSMAGGSMVRIFPNTYAHNNQIVSNKGTIVPDENLRVKLLPERGKNESVTCIASTVDIARLVTANSSAVPSKQFSMDGLLKKLTEYVSSSAFASETLEW